MNNTTEIDPVCGMKVDPATAPGSSRYEGKMYYFCSRGCEAKFDADPQKFIAGHRETMGGHSKH
ncbi:MAG TPA: YHS domain-containing protein [Thermoanaerobaculia bacterium]